MPSGNLLGFNLWPGCDFSGTNSNTTTISGLNQLRLLNLQTSAPPTCSLSGGVANMSTGLIPFTFGMIKPLTVKYVITCFGSSLLAFHLVSLSSVRPSDKLLIFKKMFFKCCVHV